MYTTSVVLVLAVSAASGLYTSAWGAFKDAPYEGFRPRTFPRSVLFSGSIALLLACSPHGIGERFLALPLFHVFLAVMGLERMVTEIYKACFRVGDQSHLQIPQQMTLFGRPVESRTARVATGIALLAGVLAVAFLPWQVTERATFVLVGTLTGLFVCCAGAYKDAPFEGFDRRKFLRSAIVLSLASPVVYELGPVPLGLLIFSFGGLERLMVEYYKSFVVHTVPGKFRPEVPRVIEGLRFRESLQCLAVLILVMVAGFYAHALGSASAGLAGGPGVHSAEQP